MVPLHHTGGTRWYHYTTQAVLDGKERKRYFLVSDQLPHQSDVYVLAYTGVNTPASDEPTTVSKTKTSFIEEKLFADDNFHIR